MIKTLTAVASKRVILDALSNEVSIIDVFESFKSQSFPMTIPDLALLFCLYRSDNEPVEKDLSLRCSIGETEVISVAVHAAFQQGKIARTIVGFDGFVIPKEGMFKIELLEGEQVIGELILPVEKLETPKPHVNIASSPIEDGSHPGKGDKN